MNPLLKVHQSMKIKIYYFILLSLLGGSLSAEITLPKFFADHMVLQRNKPINIWGSADVGESVSVQLGKLKAQTKADSEGSWRIVLPSQEAQAVGRNLVVKGSNTITLKNVLIGEVWLCAGQSNMEMPINNNKDCAEIMAKSTNDQIRLSSVIVGMSDSPQKDVFKFNTWRAASPEGLQCGVLPKRYISAVAYCFAMEMQAELQCPVGIIVAALGGTRIEPWTPESGLEELDVPIPGNSRRLHKNNRSVLYNAMIHPLAGMSLSGFVWYQGENNIGDGHHYTSKMQAMVKHWRKNWGEKLPFYFVQIAPFKYRKHERTALPELWQAQEQASELIPDAHMAVINDLGEFSNVHPQNKPQVAHRLALLARKYSFKEDLIADAPKVKKIMRKGKAIELHFSNAGKGLKLKTNTLNIFEVAGEDEVYSPATASIIGVDNILVQSSSVEKIKFVRYAWSDTPTVNLYNSNNLPAGSFKKAVD